MVAAAGRTSRCTDCMVHRPTQRTDLPPGRRRAAVRPGTLEDHVPVLGVDQDLASDVADGADGTVEAEIAGVLAFGRQAGRDRSAIDWERRRSGRNE